MSSNAELAARVRAAWQAYDESMNYYFLGDTWKTYRALADELERETGFAVTCGKLTGRPA